MPFKSKKQMRWMFANDPEMAKRWAEHTEDIKALPEKVKTKKEKVKEALSDLEGRLVKDVVKAAMPGYNKGIPPKTNPLPVKKPVTNGPTAVSPITGSAQYGANLKQNVQNTASQLVPAQQTKIGFLAKLAQGPVLPVPNTNPPVPAAADPNKPAAQPAPAPQPLGRSIWTKGVSTGSGKFSLPTHVKTRVHSQSPEDHSKATAMWNLRKFAPIEYQHKMEGKDAITSQDIADMHAHHQKRFMDFVAADPERQKTFGSNPNDLLEVISGRAGTPQQRSVAESYLNDLDQKMIDMGKRNIAMAQAKADALEKRTSGTNLLEKAVSYALPTAGLIDEGDKILKGLVGTNTKELYNLQGYGPEVQGRGLGDLSLDVLGTGKDILTSPAGYLMTMGLGRGAATGFSLVKDIGLPLIRPDQYANMASEATKPFSNYYTYFVPGASPQTRDLVADSVRQYTDAGLTGYYGLKSLGSAANAWRNGTSWTKVFPTAGNLGMGAWLGNAAIKSYDKAPSVGEVIRGERGPAYNMPVAKADSVNQTLSPGANNALPRFSELDKELQPVQVGVDDKGNPVFQRMPAYSAAGKFNLGSVGSSLATSGIDQRIASLSAMPAAQQKAEIEKINQELIATTGASYPEYTSYKSSSDKVTKARENYDAIQQQVQQDPENADLVSKFVKSEADFVYAQKEAARAATPFLTKALNKRYETEIKPLEANVGQISDQINSVMGKIQNNQPLTPEDVAVVQQGKRYMATAKDYAFEKAKLAFMRDGNLATPGIDKIFAEDGQKGFDKLSALFNGTAESLIDAKTGKPLMVKITAPDGTVKTEPLTRNTNVLESLAKKEFDEQVSKATGISTGALQPSTEVAKGPRPVNDVTGQADSDQPKTKDFLGQMGQLWKGLSGVEKMLIFGGLSLGAVGILSSLFGGSDDEDDEEGSSLPAILSILGIGAVASVPLMRYFGLTQASAPASNNSMEAVKSRAAKNQMAQIQSLAKTDPNAAADRIAQMAKADPSMLQDFQKLNKNINAPSVLIAWNSGGKLTTAQVDSLKQHWPLIKQKLGI